MRCFEVHGCRTIVFESRLPAGYADAPFVTRFESGKSPLRDRGHEIISVKHGKIEKLARHFHANGMQADIFGASPTITVSIKAGDRIATTAFQFCAKDVGRHRLVKTWFFG